MNVCFGPFGNPSPSCLVIWGGGKYTLPIRKGREREGDGGDQGKKNSREEILFRKTAEREETLKKSFGGWKEEGQQALEFRTKSRLKKKTALRIIGD